MTILNWTKWHHSRVCEVKHSGLDWS